MCGITGIFYNNGNIGSAENDLHSILTVLRHRGFSHLETDSGNGWLLGANRLEIMDRSHGQQPKYSNDGMVIVVFNGEIYNYLELKRQLTINGYNFSTETDTEVIANGYHYWGTDVFDRLDGMFAILIWDDRKKDFIAARDPMGVKPLYFNHFEDRIIFASEMKALKDFSNNIETVPPGHYIVGGSLPVRYYEYRPTKLDATLEENALILRSYIRHAVEKRVKTDLAIAVFLSGGIDSSAILYEAAQLHPDVTAFSIGYPNSADVQSAERLCKHLSVPFVHVSVSAEELLQLIPEVVWTIESFEPNHIRGGTLSYVLSREVAKRKYKIALCGEGADELFGGYREFGIALAKGYPKEVVEQLFERFLAELYKTQLQRVDRTSMKFTLEVREPYLDRYILDFAHALPFDQKISLSSNRSYQNKIVLREAYKDILPDWVVSREKEVLSMGAGFGSNAPEGIFYEKGMEMVSEEEFILMRVNYPEFSLNSREETYYFKLFLEKFGKLNIARERPLVSRA